MEEKKKLLNCHYKTWRITAGPGLILFSRGTHGPHAALNRLEDFSMDDEWEEEEQLVLVELSGIINNDFVTKCCGTCKILDIDSEKPMMQVGQYVFAGEYEDALGTCVIFEEGPPKGKAKSGPELKYMCHTAKKLMMQRVFLAEKKEGESNIESCHDGDEESATCQKEQSN